MTDSPIFGGLELLAFFVAGLCFFFALDRIYRKNYDKAEKAYGFPRSSLKPTFLRNMGNPISSMFVMSASGQDLREMTRPWLSIIMFILAVISYQQMYFFLAAALILLGGAFLVKNLSKTAFITLCLIAFAFIGFQSIQ